MDTQTISQCLEVIKWKRYRDGSYSGEDPFLAIQDKLRQQEPLSKAEVLLLLQANEEGIQEIQKRQHLPDTLAKAQTLSDMLRSAAWGKQAGTSDG